MNKYKLLIIICFFLVTISLPIVKASIKKSNLEGKTIVLDAGHGGIDEGARSGKIIEKELNLILTKKLEQELKSRGAIIYQTRDTDRDLSTSPTNRKRTDLYNRAKYINNIAPSMYISLHLNSSPSSKWKGLQIFYTVNNKENKKIAEEMTNYLRENIPNVRDIKKDNIYYMYKFIKYPGVLIEAGFISNPNDNYLLRQENYQDKLVSLIADSLEKYYENK